MANSILFIFLAALVAVVSSVSLPSYLKPCDVSGDFSDCLLQTARTSLSKVSGGIPELNVEPFDPLHVGRLNTKTNDLMMDLKDLTVKGLKNAKIEKLSINLNKNNLKMADFDKTNLNFDCYISEVTLKSPYVASGKILNFNISGNGQATIKVEQLKLTSIADIEKYRGSDGKQHIRAKNPVIRFTNGKTTFALTNLFDGDEFLSALMHNILNNNWKAVSNEIGGPAIQAAGLKVVAIINQLLAAVPLDNLITGA